MAALLSILPASMIPQASLPWLEQTLIKQFEQLHTGEIRISISGGSSYVVRGEQAGPSADIHIEDVARLLKSVVIRGDLGFAESYMDGYWSSHDLTKLLYVLTLNLDAYEATSRKSLPAHWFAKLLHRLNANSLKGSRRNIAAHYDLGNDFYTQWLDPGMSYSSAVYYADEPLEEAQERKYEYLLSQIDPEPGDHILEIGCGWGGFVEYAARWDMKVTAVTLSQEQYDYTVQRVNKLNLNDRVEVLLTDYRTLHGQYDHIVSIEMFEAVGQEYWSEYFSVLDRCLKPGGRAALQVITIAEEHFEDYQKNEGGFIQRYIFPGGMLPTETHLRELSWEVDLDPLEVTRYGEHYAATLADWKARFNRKTDWLEAHGYDEKFRRMWRYYLSFCEAGFNEGRLDLVHLTMQKP